MYVLVGNYFLDIRGMVLEHWLWLTLTAWTGTALALVVSTVVNTERAALTAVPLLLVPQMLLAGALVPYREMNRGLFENIGIDRERGGAPVPSALMPLRYAYEGMVVTQATRNPFEFERLRLQRKINLIRDQGEPMNAAHAERFELLKEGLRRLLAAGAETPEEAADLVARIARIARYGSKLEVETMKVWPDAVVVYPAAVYPAAEFFVNERIDLLVREAETFRNDYRDKQYRNIFLALQKPLPFAGLKKAELNEVPGKPARAGVSKREMATGQYGGLILSGLVFGCWMLASFILSYQNRRTR
ncbi:MAG: ABC transporter permease, partial [Verrucomicrobiota bacterium]